MRSVGLPCVGWDFVGLRRRLPVLKYSAAPRILRAIGRVTDACPSHVGPVPYDIGADTHTHFVCHVPRYQHITERPPEMSRGPVFGAERTWPTVRLFDEPPTTSYLQPHWGCNPDTL